ncbi:fumarylacetoacetate hydrolase family protein [Marinibacterium sp. SX1]|uniref:fumarylacetoacetate hydrolase family protein n=1 Tax=Marinibacterium sp. SX1 TaxID=3388424 RepID=UPI003D17EE8A
MRLATLPDGTPDGRLHLVSRDNRRCAPSQTARTLQAALDDWARLEPGLRAEQEALDTGGGQPFDPSRALAPLPRAWQWLDASAFDTHGELMARAFGMDPAPRDRPLMYQGLSDRFLSGTEDVALPSEDDGIDFEGEFGVICDAVPMGATPAQAAAHIRLLVQINDWSLRTIAPVEMKTGFGWVQAKPACSVAPVAVTPDELGPAWHDARVHLPLVIDWNGRPFGAASGGEMAFGFDDLVAHAARTRQLVAGTIIGSGTVSNANHATVGSSCISEVRAIEMAGTGQIATPFMAFGDRVRMEAKTADGQPLFGPIDQRIVRA